MIFSPVPVPVPEKYCFNIISLKLVYQVFKLMSLQIYFIFTFCFEGLNLNILHGNYSAYGYKTKDLESLKQALTTMERNIKMSVFCLLSS